MNGMPSERPFRLEELPPAEFLDRLGERFRITAGPTRTFRRTYFDTFDWRLHRAGHVLSHVVNGRSRELELGDLSGASRRRFPCEQPPEFRAGLPEPLAQELAKSLEVRRLLPLARVDLEESVHAVLDDEDKTVVRIVLEHALVRPPQRGSKGAAEPIALASLVRVQAVRGYEREHGQAVRWLAEDLGLSEESTPGLEAALSGVGRTVRDYALKPTVHLEPKERSDAALKRILNVLADTIDRNTPGAIADLDSEFLHDLRVATRRTRAALSRVKNVLEPEALQRFAAEFRWLGNVTGPTRDLDVLSEKLDEYLGLLGESEREQLGGPLAERIAAERVRAQKQLARALRSQRFRGLLTEWRAFLAEGSAPSKAAAPKASVAIGKLAAIRLRKTFARTIEIGTNTHRTSPDADVHELRIQCKKLRYLLEFFRSLYAADEIDAMVKALKGLQNVLGDFNDFSVHRDYLGELASSLPPGLELALGALRERLRLEQERERERFEERFQRFAGRENCERAEHLFGKRRRG